MKTIVKYFGGAHYKASWIIRHMPVNYSECLYIEPFFGGGSVFFQKLSSVTEIINDLDVSLMSMWLSIRDRPEDFQNALAAISYNQISFEKFKNSSPCNTFDIGIREFFLLRASRSGLKGHFAWSNRLRGELPGDENAWYSAIKRIPEVSKRLADTDIRSGERAIDIIDKFRKRKDVVFYLDPPFLHSTRVTTNAYNYEMSEDDHIGLAETLNEVQGKVLLSGYSSELYKQLYKGWNKDVKALPNHASQNNRKSIKIDCLWTNF